MLKRPRRCGGMVWTPLSASPLASAPPLLEAPLAIKTVLEIAIVPQFRIAPPGRGLEAGVPAMLPWNEELRIWSEALISLLLSLWKIAPPPPLGLRLALKTLRVILTGLRLPLGWM